MRPANTRWARAQRLETNRVFNRDSSRSSPVSPAFQICLRLVLALLDRVLCLFVVPLTIQERIYSRFASANPHKHSAALGVLYQLAFISMRETCLGAGVAIEHSLDVGPGFVPVAGGCRRHPDGGKNQCQTDRPIHRKILLCDRGVCLRHHSRNAVGGGVSWGPRAVAGYTCSGACRKSATQTRLRQILRGFGALSQGKRRQMHSWLIRLG